MNITRTKLWFGRVIYFVLYFGCCVDEFNNESLRVRLSLDIYVYVSHGSLPASHRLNNKHLFLRCTNSNVELHGSYSLYMVQWLNQISLCGNHIFIVWLLKSPHPALRFVLNPWLSFYCPVLNNLSVLCFKRAENDNRRQKYIMKNCEYWLFL